jgi:hypothetical protein
MAELRSRTVTHGRNTAGARARLRGLSMPWPEIVANAGVWAAALGIAQLDD